MFVERTTGDGVRGALPRFLGALSGLLAIAVGGPWALVVVARRSCGGWSPFHGLPTPADWSTEGVRTALTQRLTDSTVADVVVRTGLVVGWLAVVVIVWSVIAELVHLVRFDGIGVPDVRLLGPPQRLARIIASGLLVAVPVVGSGRTLAVGAVPLTPQPVSGASASWVGDDETTRRTVPRSGSDDQGASARSTGVPVHVVVAGDSVHSIAQRLAGPDQRSVTELADRILDLNLGRTMADGQVFVNAAFIDVGWTLELPVDPPVETRAGPVHTVDHGESLWSIADEHLGAGRRWSEIFDANDGRTFADGRRLDDPDLIMPGWQLELPMVPVDEVPVEQV
ncbi:MAG: LysM peptidoglycan-binding domain-containing protein, partial [Ilumatobacteraceae bacterium]